MDTSERAGVAAVLSFVFSGLGQLYNGQILKGLVIIFLSASSVVVVIAGAICIGSWMLERVVFPGQLGLGVFAFAAGVFLAVCLGIYSIVDAYRVALRK